MNKMGNNIKLKSNNRRISRKSLVQISLVVASVLFALLCCESVLQLLNYPEDIEYGWPSVPFPVWVKQPGPDEFVVAFVGDSQVEGSEGVKKSPADYLQDELNALAPRDPSGPRYKFKVFAVASGGWGQDQQLLTLQNYFSEYRADMVVLWETPENDPWNNAFPTHWPVNGTPKPTYILRDDLLVGPVRRSEIIPWWTESKLGLLATQLCVKVTSINRESSTRECFLFDPDGRWDKHYLPPAAQHAGRNDATFAQADFETINPYMADDAISLEKSHIVLGISPSSERIAYMVKLTNQLLLAIQSLATANHAGFLAFSYNADNTAQPLYPPDGYYRNAGYHKKLPMAFQVSRAVRDQRLKEMNNKVNYYEIPLLAKHWRRDMVTKDGRILNVDPHLSDEVNQEVLHDVAQLVVKNIQRSRGK